MANLIVKLAIRKPHVTYAAYRIEHPLVGEGADVMIGFQSNDSVSELIKA